MSVPAGQYVTVADFQRYIAEQEHRYEITRKLITEADLSLKQQINALDQRLTTLINTPPSPAAAREFWVKQLPRIREELLQVKTAIAQLNARLNKEPVNV